MKKTFLNIMLLSVGLFLMGMSNIKAVSYEEMNQYMVNAVSKNQWVVSDGKDSNTYAIKILVGNTSDENFNAVYDKVGKIQLGNIKLYPCPTDGTTCNFDNARSDNLIWLALKKADSDGNVYLQANSTTINGYNKLKEAKSAYYVARINGEWVAGDKYAEGTVQLNFTDNNEEDIDRTLGTKSNPIIINKTGSIKIPNRLDSFWTKTDKRIYFKIEMEENWGRFSVAPHTATQYIWYDDPTSPKSIWQDGYTNKWQLLNDGLYQIYMLDKSLYGQTVTISFVDGNPLQLCTDTQMQMFKQEYSCVDQGCAVVYSSDVCGVPEEEINPGGSDNGGNNGGNNGDTTKEECAILGSTVTPIVGWAIRIIQMAAIILVVVLTIVDFAGVVISGEEKNFKEAGKKFSKRLLVGIAVAFTPMLLAYIIDLSGVLGQYGIDRNQLFCSFF